MLIYTLLLFLFLLVYTHHKQLLRTVLGAADDILLFACMFSWTDVVFVWQGTAALLGSPRRQLSGQGLLSAAAAKLMVYAVYGGTTMKRCELRERSTSNGAYTAERARAISRRPYSSHMTTAVLKPPDDVLLLAAAAYDKRVHPTEYRPDVACIRVSRHFQSSRT